MPLITALIAIAVALIGTCAIKALLIGSDEGREFLNAEPKNHNEDTDLP